MIPKIQFIPLGGASEIGANSYYINWNNKIKILLDCGTREEGPTFHGLPDFTKADSKVDYIVITHAHHDHIGGLPFAKRFFSNVNSKIIMTKITSDIAYYVLEDSGKIILRKNEESRIPIFSQTVKNLYSKGNIYKLCKDVISLDYGQEFNLTQDIKLFLYDASHVYGSACVYITDGEISLLYTGDFNDSNTNFHNGINLPDNLNVDVLITEVTNGAKSSKSLSMEEKIKKLGDIIKDSIKLDGRVLIPSFALGRTQEVLLSIQRLKEMGIIERNVKVYISPGLSQKLTAYYFKNFLKKPSYAIIRNGFLPEKGSITISTSGFFTKESIAGQIAQHIKNDLNSVIIFPSDYAYKEFKDRKRWESWFKDYKCRIESIDFSAHSSTTGIISLVNKLKPKKIILVHGNIDAVQNVSNLLNNDSVIAPESNGDEYVFYKNADDLKLHSSIKDRSYLITVGTSLKNKSIENDYDAKEYSAELNTFLNIPDLDLNNSLCHLIATTQSIDEAKKISCFLEEKKQIPTVIHVVDVKFENSILSKSMEMTDIISKLSSLMLRSKNAVMVFTGGFKFEVATSYLLTNLYGIPSYYKHEDQDRQKDKSLRLQSIPITIDIEPYLFYRNHIKLIISSDYNIAKKYFKNLPENIRNIFTVTQDSIMLNNFGSVVYGLIEKEYKKFEYNHIKSKVIMADFLDYLWISKYSHNFLDLIYKPVSSGFSIFIYKLLVSNIVESIVFGKVSQLNSSINGIVKVVFDRIVNRRKIFFKIYVKDKVQLLIVVISRDGLDKIKKLLNISPGEYLEYEIDRILTI